MLGSPGCDRKNIGPGTPDISKGIGRTLTTGFCRLCHGKSSSRRLRNAFGKVPVVGASSEKQRRVDRVFFSDFQRLLGVSFRQDPALPQFVCKNCHAQFYKCRSVLNTFIQKVNVSPAGHTNNKIRGSDMHTQSDTGKGPCIVDLVTSSPQCLRSLVIWSHAHAGDCQSVPNLQSVLSSQYCGIIRAVWGCGAGHTYVMDTDSDYSTLLVDNALSAKWNRDKSTDSHLTGNGTGTDNSEAISASRTPRGPVWTDRWQQSPNNETPLQTVVLGNQTSPSINVSLSQLNSTVSLSERDPQSSSVQGPVSSTQPSEAAEETPKDETSDLSEGDLLSEDEEGEKNDQSLEEFYSASSDKTKVSSKRNEHNEAKKSEELKERKKPGPKPGWKNKLKSEREELPTIFKCPYQGCTAVYRGADGMKKHIKEHHEQVRERPCPHPGCNKVFMIDRYLQRHVKLIHTEERNYICDQCGQTFKQRKHLSVHQMRHSGAKPLQCEICGFQCRQRASLKYHMTKHKAEAELDFACDQCGKRFEKAHNLNVHMSMVHPLTQNHDQARPIETEEKHFEKAHDLNIHVSMVRSQAQSHDQDRPLETEETIILGDEDETETLACSNVKPEMAIEQDPS